MFFTMVFFRIKRRTVATSTSNDLDSYFIEHKELDNRFEGRVQSVCDIFELSRDITVYRG